ncbi:MAG: two-component sensor histidine kinase [Lachnospiraceae bacterium]|nr:two-component sensor histidine kinase [Lachnospiraceae bacterium]
MTKTIFRNTFFVGILVLALCGFLFFGIQYRQSIDETREAMGQEAGYLEKGISFGGIDFLKSVEGSNRITLTDASGKVLYDSEENVPYPGKGKCVEVELTLKNGKVLKLSRPMSAVRDAFILVSPVLWVLVLVVLISGVLAFHTAKQIVEPINNLDFDNPDANPYQELTPMLDKIAEQKLTIQEETTQREEMRREFSANVSRELKTPLTSISGYAGLLARGEVAADKVPDFAKDICKETENMIALVDDIMKISRLDEEDSLPKKEEVDLKNLSTDVAEAIRPVAAKNNITVQVTGEGGVINGDFSILYEMVYNLCDNAVKYNFPGGSVTIDVTPSDSNIKLSVKDTGIGIPKEHQKRVFERFYRVDKSHSTDIGGTGLGLSIVKHGALFHEAEVSLESEEGVGTTITLSFPRN